MKVLLRLFVIMLSITAITGCSGEEQAVEIPSSVLSKKKMVDVMIEMHLLEAALNLNYITEAQLKESGKYEQAFKDHGVSEKDYEESLKFYTNHPKLMLEIYDELLDELSTRQAQLSEHQISEGEKLETTPSIDSVKSTLTTGQPSK